MKKSSQECKICKYSKKAENYFEFLSKKSVQNKFFSVYLIVAIAVYWTGVFSVVTRHANLGNAAVNLHCYTRWTASNQSTIPHTTLRISTDIEPLATHRKRSRKVAPNRRRPKVLTSALKVVRGIKNTIVQRFL